MPNREEILLRLGLDPTSLNAGTLKQLDAQKKAAMEYASFWDAALKKRDAEESAMNDRSIAKARAASEARIRIQQEEMAKLAAQNLANQEISAGSGGYGWAGGAGGAPKAAEAAAHGVGRELREINRLTKELAAGNWAGAFVGVFKSMGRVISRITTSLFGPFGMALAAIGVAAYALYEDIKKFTKELDELGKQNAESIGNTHKAIIDATDAGIKSAAEYEGHIKSLAAEQETLAHWVAEATRAINEQAAAQQKLMTAGGNQKLAAINLAEHMGMISPAAAATARTNVNGSTFYQVEKSKQDALAEEGQVLAASKRYAEQHGHDLETAGRRAQAAVTGVDEHGNITNQAAFDRNKQMRERANLEADIRSREDRVNAAGSGSDLEHWAGNALDPLHGSKAALTEGDKEIIAKEKALLKSREEQNRHNIAAQTAAEEAYKRAVKAIEENAQSLKSVNEQLEQYKTKTKDAATAQSQLHADLVAKALNNESAQIGAWRGMDRVTPTIEMLAGRRVTDRINKAYGAGGQYDLEKGDGPFAGIAQKYELAQKQQMWDIIHGNAQFNAQGELVGGAAFGDKTRATQLRSMLGQAGIETPQMQMQSLIESGRETQRQLVALNQIMGNSPKVIVAGTD